MARLLDGPRRPAPWLVALAVAASLAYYSQPIFAVGLIPFVALLVLRRRRVADVAVLAVGFAACTAGYWWIRGSGDVFWAPPLLDDRNVSASLDALPTRLFASATGVYILGDPLPAGTWTRLLADAWCVAVVVAALASLQEAVAARRATVGLASLLAALAVVGFTLVMNPALFGVRHLLPLHGFAAVLVASQIARLGAAAPPRWLVAVGAVFTLLAVVASFREIGPTNFSGTQVPGTMVERDALQELADHLDERGIRHVYCFGPMLQWKLMFFSGGAVSARWFAATDRNPAFPEAVDAAFAAGEPVAIVGEAPDVRMARMQFGSNAVEQVADRYFVFERPPPATVRRFFAFD